MESLLCLESTRPVPARRASLSLSSRSVCFHRPSRSSFDCFALLDFCTYHEGCLLQTRSTTIAQSTPRRTGCRPLERAQPAGPPPPPGTPAGRRPPAPRPPSPPPLLGRDTPQQLLRPRRSRHRRNTLKPLLPPPRCRRCSHNKEKLGSGSWGRSADQLPDLPDWSHRGRCKSTLPQSCRLDAGVGPHLPTRSSPR